MDDPLLLPSVSLRDLNRKPGEVLNAVFQGQRLVVRRYGRPVATIQPIDGFVLDPLSGEETDICGNPLGELSEEVGKLSDVERELIARSDHLMNRVTFSCSSVGATQARKGMDRLVLRGLLEKTTRGLILTGRGLMIREWLHARGRHQGLHPQGTADGPGRHL